MATRTLINLVKGGQSLVIFPEGRITVTGSLMKVYDGAGLIADKSEAMVVPVRIDGLEATPFSRLSRDQVRRRWFPRVTMTVLPPVRLLVAPDLRGRSRRQAAGAALYSIMSDLVFRTTPTDRSVFEAVVEAASVHGHGRVAVEDIPSHGHAQSISLVLPPLGALLLAPVDPGLSTEAERRAERAAPEGRSTSPDAPAGADGGAGGAPR